MISTPEKYITQAINGPQSKESGVSQARIGSSMTTGRRKYSLLDDENYVHPWCRLKTISTPGKNINQAFNGPQSKESGVSQARIGSSMTTGRRKGNT